MNTDTTLHSLVIEAKTHWDTGKLGQHRQTRKLKFVYGFSRVRQNKH